MEDERCRLRMGEAVHAWARGRAEAVVMGEVLAGCYAQQKVLAQRSQSCWRSGRRCHVRRVSVGACRGEMRFSHSGLAPSVACKLDAGPQGT